MTSGYPFQVLAIVAPAALSIKEVVSGGNILLATAAALLAVLAGRWALRKQRLEAETAAINKEIAELKLRKELNSSR